MSKRKARVIDGIEVHQGTRNVYADLGYPDADEMLIKAKLVSKISEIVRGRGLTQARWPRFLACLSPRFPPCFVGNFAESQNGN